jgi:hypothetical protein
MKAEMHGQHWTANEHDAMMMAFNCGLTVNAIALAHGRTENSIYMRLMNYIDKSAVEEAFLKDHAGIAHDFNCSLCRICAIGCPFR